MDGAYAVEVWLKILKDSDVLLNIEAVLQRSNLRLDAVHRYRKASERKPISEK